jgi:hypothetical protein
MNALLIDEKGVRDVLCIGRNLFLKLRKTDPKFPKPIQLHQRNGKHLWRVADLEQYVAQLGVYDNV